MKPRLLLLALLVAPISSQALSPQDAALVRVEQEATRWTDWQPRAAEMESAYANDAIKNSAAPGRILNCLSSVDKIKAMAERRMSEWRNSRVAAWNAQAAAGTIATDEAARRAGFADRLFRMRMLLLYGNLVPRTIDECANGEDSRADEQLSAGAWALAASKKDFNLAEKELVRISGLSEEDAYPH